MFGVFAANPILFGGDALGIRPSYSTLPGSLGRRDGETE